MPGGGAVAEASPGPRHARPLGPQSRAVVAWKVVEYVGLILFTIIMPRRMGPALYGRFAALLSLIGLLTMASAMGAQATFGRFVPEYDEHGQPGRIRGLFTLLFGMRAVFAGLLAAALLLFSRRVLPGATPAMAAAGAAAFLSVALAMVCYQLLYGLNLLGRSLTHDSLVRLVLIGLVFMLGGQRDVDRAALAVFLVEFGFLLLGLVWTRSYFAPAEAIRYRSNLPAQLRFGLSFFGANLLLLAVWRGGELAVLYLSGDPAEVAYYSVPNAVAMAFAALIGQLGVLLVPSLTRLHVSGRPESMESLLGVALKYLTISAFAFLLVVHAFGPWLVRHALGNAYLPVIANLETLALGLLPIPLVRSCLSVAIVRKEARKALVMAAGGVVAFAALGIALVPGSGSQGASMAAALAVAITGVLGAVEFSLWPVLKAVRFGWLLACGGLAALVFALPWGARPVLGAAATLLFVTSLFLSRVVSTAELRRLAGAFVS